MISSGKPTPQRVSIASCKGRFPRSYFRVGLHPLVAVMGGSEGQPAPGEPSRRLKAAASSSCLDASVPRTPFTKRGALSLP